MNADFDTIRPFNNDELPQAFAALLREPAFMALMQRLLPQLTIEQLEQQLQTIHSASELQQRIIEPVLTGLEKQQTAGGVTVSGLEADRPNGILVTNHRDIVMDAAFIALSLFRGGFDSPEIGIGDNLFAAPWIETLVRINKCFVVRRGLAPREMPRVFLLLSQYIRYAITQKQVSVWIAQREGRAKDSDDRTQESILKMFALSGEGSFIQNLKDLNISPVSISYEYDPCDFLKAAEFQLKRDNPNYQKSPHDDVVSMRTGIMGYKGHVHYAFTPCINADLDVIAAQTDNRKEQVAAVAALIDRRIHGNYVIYPINKVAYDEYFGTQRFADEVPADERQKVLDYFAKQLDKIAVPQPDYDFLRRKLLEMYANPLKNYLATL